MHELGARSEQESQRLRRSLCVFGLRGATYLCKSGQTFLLTDMGTGEIVFSFPLPMVALGVRGRFISSYAIRGVQVANPTKQWRIKYEQYVEEFASRGEDMPDVFMLR